jgi:putative lipoprotein
MRRVFGEIVLPADVPSVTASVLVELRDVSVADVPSTVLAATQMRRVLRPGGVLAFSLEAPEAERSRSLSLRVHVDVDGDGRVSSGDLLTTSSYDVPVAGDRGPLEIRVVRI